jgi:hypothetical protein
MTHAESRELLLDFAYGELPAHVAVEVEEHLTGCDECRVEKQQLEGVRKAFTPIRESEEPGAGFDERILAAARAEARLEHDGNVGQVVEVAASVAPAGLDAARINAHAAPVARSPARGRPKWMTRAMLGGSVAAAAALALVVGTSRGARERPAASAENFQIHVAPQGAPPAEAEAAKDTALARNDTPPVQAAPPPAAPPPAPAAAAPVVQQPSSDVRSRASLAAKKSKARAIEEGSGGDVPNAAELALRGALAENESKAQAGAGARAASNGAPAHDLARQLAAAAPEPQAPADGATAAANSSLHKQEAAAAAPRPANPGDLERRAEAARHGGNYALAAGLYREAATGRESDSSAAAWDLAHAVECLAAGGSFDEARKVRDQLGTSYPAEANAFAAARRALREVDSNSKY